LVKVLHGLGKNLRPCIKEVLLVLFKTGYPCVHFCHGISSHKLSLFLTLLLGHEEDHKSMGIVLVFTCSLSNNDVVEGLELLWLIKLFLRCMVWLEEDEASIRKYGKVFSPSSKDTIRFPVKFADLEYLDEGSTHDAVEVGLVFLLDIVFELQVVHDLTTLVVILDGL
jgi:hypothetical protein